MSDGTLAGTHQVVDLLPGTGSGVVAGTLTAIPGSSRVVFVGTDGVDGQQLFVCDGTPSGTRQLGWIAPAGSGSGAATIGGLTVVGDELLFWCDDGTTGKEPWIVSLTAGNPQPFALTSAYGEGCPGTGGLLPRVTSRTEPILGNTGFTIELYDAVPATLAVALLSIAPADIPLQGPCRARVLPPLVSLATIFTDAAGHGSSSYAMPSSPSLAGATVFAQYVVLDVQGAWGNTFALSEGLRIALGL